MINKKVIGTGKKKNRSDDTFMDLWQRDAMIRWWTLFACVPHDSPADPKLASW
jgi:hypothetical protein